MQNNLNGSFTPVIIYDNADTNKVMILRDNKGKTGVYQWTHKESGRVYIGSAADLSKRLRTYYSFSHLNRNKSMYINNALLLHGLICLFINKADYSSLLLPLFFHRFMGEGGV